MTPWNVKIGMVEVVVVEGHEAFRQSLEFYLNLTGRIDCKSYGSGEEAIEALTFRQPAVLLTEIRLPGGMDGIACTRIIKERWPEVHVLMCTKEMDDDQVFDALRAGASGYLCKESGMLGIVEAIRQVVAGGAPMSPSVARRVVSSFYPMKFNQGPDALSEREEQVLELLCKGSGSEAIALQLFISPNTVRTHIRHIYEKLRVRSRVEAVNKVFRK